MTTDRIDSERELIEFIENLKMANIKIPENVTLEIDSYDLQNCINYSYMWEYTLPFTSNRNVDRFKYMGEKIMFKKKQI